MLDAVRRVKVSRVSRFRPVRVELPSSGSVRCCPAERDALLGDWYGVIWVTIWEGSLRFHVRKGFREADTRRLYEAALRVAAEGKWPQGVGPRDVRIVASVNLMGEVAA